MKSLEKLELIIDNISLLIIQYDEKYKKSLKDLEEILCEKHRFQALLFNCPLRVNEGMMINHSLKELTEDVKGLLRNSVLIKTKDKDYLPIFYDKDISSSYRDLYVEDDAFSVFNSEKSKYEAKGYVMNIIKNDLLKKKNEDGEDIPGDLDSLNFVIVNIINTTDSQGKEVEGVLKSTKNNPPTPPYINITNLIYNLPQSRGYERNISYG